MAESQESYGKMGDEESLRNGLTLPTADRFCSRWLSREELLERISKGSGFDHRLASVSLILIEARVDIYLESQGTIFVDGLGNIHDAAKQEAYPHAHEGRTEWAKEALQAVYHDSEGESIWLHWFGRTSRRLTKLVEALEVCATLRAPWAYEIFCSSKAESYQPRQKVAWGRAFPHLKEVANKEGFSKKHSKVE
jgi:hypothetical protein